MNYKDDYCNPDTVDMADYSEADLYEKAVREVRKEERQRAKETHRDYKLKLPYIKRGWKI